jgi:predicted nucleic acid-binding protein
MRSTAHLFSVLLSQPLLLEYEAVLSRPEQMEVHGQSLQQISDFLDNFVAQSIRVSFDRRLRPQLRDPNDELVLETAVNGLADAIVTHNIKDFLPEAAKFGIHVLMPGHIIKGRLKI